ncbi:MAG: SDR family NAD(P)-dependent oxidoreductase [Lachnospiraceae bacterium]|nr:SDR family NAD(P)-dependent oxidoreductase [Lachnospiraceae bacterium]
MDYPFDKNSVFLVTGGAGFIGSNICEKLAEAGYRVICLDDLSNGKYENIAQLEGKDGFSFIKGDIRDFDVCLKVCEGVDFVLHQAALGSVIESMEKPELYEAVNVCGMENMLKAAVINNVKKFVYASSAAVYGDSGKRIAKEGEEGAPISVYAETKLKNELTAKDYAGYIDVYGLRYFNVYGKRQRYDSSYSAVIPNFVSKMIKGEQVCINGDGLQTRDFVYVDDVVQANLKACLADSRSSGEAFNIACGSETSIKELYDVLENILGAKKEPLHGPAVKGDIRFSCADISKAVNMLGYKPEYDFEAGIRASAKWYKNNI